MMNKTNISIFASGGGSNAEKIIEYFKNHAYINVRLVVCNNPQAGVITIAKKHNIDVLPIDNGFSKNPQALIAQLDAFEVKWVVLAGFLRKIPEEMISYFKGRIINIHPALLPKYGGQGMYGHFVHEAVVGNHEIESGITIHYVDGIYDHGKTILQVTCPVLPNDTPELLAKRVLELEHANFSREIENTILASV